MFKENTAGLLERVGIPPAKGTRNYGIVISFHALAHVERLPAILSDFHKLGERLRGALGTNPLQISETAFALLTEQTEYSALGVVADLKMLLLKLIGGHDPQVFGSIDQSRLVRVFEIPRQRNDFVALLYHEANRPSQAQASRSLRTLMPSDVEHIMSVLDGMSRQEFVDKFVKSQPIAVIKRRHNPAVAINEYFVSMRLIQERIVPGANIMLSRPTFNMLVSELDQRVIDCLLKRTIDGRLGSFNFNLDTFFTRRFEELGARGLARHLLFELRLSDIVENFERFLVARKLVRSLGARIAVDGVLPSMLGAVKPAAFDCAFVKIYYDDAMAISGSQMTREIDEIVRSGSRVILARVESRDALEVGLELGVEVFQGFYIDDLLKDANEREKFIAA